MPPVLIPPQKGRPLKLYISTAEDSIRAFFAQGNDESKEQVVYYFSRTLNDVERHYTPIKKLCLTLYFATIKLRH